MRGKAVWILSFFTILSALNTITAIVLAIELGIQANFQPYLIDTLIGAIPVYFYLIASILATLILLGATSSSIVNELSKIEILNEINERAAKLQDGQAILQSGHEALKSTGILLKQAIDQTQKQIAHNFDVTEKLQKKNHADLTKSLEYESANIITKIRKNLKDDFGKQEKNLEQLHKNLTSKLESESVDIKTQIGIQLQELEKTLQESEKRAKKNTKTITKQKKEITDIREKITNLEQEFIQPKTLLTSQSNPKQIRGIGPNTNDELKKMGITNIGELILADPKTIAQKTSTSEKTAKKLQGIAQLSMIPSLEDKDILLLEEIGITNQQELAEQTPIEIGRKINKNIQEQIDSGKISETQKPTIEQITLWIKYAKI